MFVGLALTNSIEPTDAAATVILAVADNTNPSTFAVAVIGSEPEQPMAEYVAVAAPVTVVIDGSTITSGSAQVDVLPASLALNVTPASVIYAGVVEETKNMAKCFKEYRRC